jgi:hypothetical protein
MSCLSPIKAYKTIDGRVLFGEKKNNDITHNLLLPCRGCLFCRTESQYEWLTRLMCEKHMNQHCYFLTLTYNDNHLPDDYSFNYSDVQKFLKRVRSHFLDEAITFYVVGEYGEENGRPHYHLLVFGFNLYDKDPCGSSSFTGDTRYRSKLLDKLWGLGYTEVGSVTPQSIGYVIGYIQKRITGDMAQDHYSICNADTGEIISRVPEFSHMSLKRPIGKSYYQAYQNEIINNDRIVFDNITYKVPRYFDYLTKRYNPEKFEEILYNRLLKLRKVDPYEFSPERMRIKAEIKQIHLDRKTKKYV